MTCSLHTQTWKDCAECAVRCKCGKIGTLSLPEPTCVECAGQPLGNNESLQRADNHQQGWVCPRCNVVHAPFVRACECRP